MFHIDKGLVLRNCITTLLGELSPRPYRKTVQPHMSYHPSSTKGNLLHYIMYVAYEYGTWGAT